MKKAYLIISVLFLVNHNIFSQNLHKVDNIVKYYPEINSIKELAEKVNYDFKNSDLEKIRAIYTWIGLNLEYDDLSYNSKLLKSPEFVFYYDEDDLEWIKKRKIKEIAKKAFYTKKGLCTGYAYLFHTLCNLMNIDNELVYGYTKTSFRDIGIIPDSKNHVWNTVKINDKWLFFDITYGSGYAYKGVWQRKTNYAFFNADKNLLKLTHFPSDQKWNRYIEQKKLNQFCYDPFYQQAYLKNKIEIIKPKIGEIIVNKKEKIKLTLKKSKKINDIKYLYLHDNKIYSAQIDNRDDSFTNIYFKNPKKNTSLHIYINNELALEYKITVH